jgi:uncharacterized protein YutE (UPF0331/DUF86 family)
MKGYMVDLAKVEERLRRLKEFTADLLRLKGLPKEEFLSDSLRVAAAKYLLLTSIECCLDIANHIIASEGFRAPTDYADSFKVLHENAIVPREFLPALQQMARFRNRLVHLYWIVDDEVVYETLQNNLGDFDRFARLVSHYVSGPPS